MEEKLSPRRRLYDRGMRGLVWLCAGLTCALLLFLIGYIFYRGVPGITWSLLTSQTSYIKNTVGILPNILDTLYIIVVAMVIVLPLGVGAAIYLTEYASNRRLVSVIEFATETLTGIPSIIFGLFGMALFVNALGFGDSIIAGSFTLGLLALPLVIRTTEEALKAVPDSYRTGSLALGATKLQTIWRVVLPTAFPNITTGLILSIGRVSGETAPILFTAAAYFLPKLPTSIYDQVMALPYHLYVIATSGTDLEATRPMAYGTALVLIVIVLAMNLLASFLRRHFGKKVKTN